ncbi:MAG: sigma-70 family RNA polymerase sigma factor [Planctomycetota bacterium]
MKKSDPSSSHTPHPEPQEWLDKYGDSLFRFATLRLGNSHLAEDLVQETLTKAFQAYRKFRQDSSIRTWLFQILRNEISSHFRSAATRKRSNEPVTDEMPGIGSLLHSEMDNEEFQNQLEKDEFRQKVQECLGQLPEHFLDTFLLRMEKPEEKVENLSKQLGIKTSNFSVRMFRARLLLRKCLESNWLND